jgi:hypothetical protein
VTTKLILSLKTLTLIICFGGVLSKKAKEKKTQGRHKRFEEPCGIVYREEKYEDPLAEKIIFLDKENREKLRGYKAFLNMWPSGELSLTLTGLSTRSAYSLFESLTQMKDEEIHGQ